VRIPCGYRRIVRISAEKDNDLFCLYEQGVLRGWSIGFVPLKARLLPEAGTAVGQPLRRGLLIEEWDLLEYSAVPIPENPGALTVALQKGLVHDGRLCDWLRHVPDDRGGRWWRAGPAVRADAFADLLG